MAAGSRIPAPDHNASDGTSDIPQSTLPGASDPQVEHAQPLAVVLDAVRQPGMPLSRMVATIMDGYADRPAFGERVRELVSDPATGTTAVRLLPRFDTVTYRELWSRVGAVAADWYHHDTAPLRAGDFVGTLGFTSIDYATVDLACVWLGAVCVPLQSGASVGHLSPIVGETELRLLACSVQMLDTAVELALANPTVLRLMVFDYEACVDEQRDALAAARTRLTAAGSPLVITLLAEAIDHGRTLPEAPQYAHGRDEDPLTLLIYTSGSTGIPKGAMYPESLIRPVWAGRLMPTDGSLPMIGVNYHPMSHLAGRSALIRGLVAGGTGYFTASSDLSTLFEDIALVRPTEVHFVPRICDMVFQHYRSELDRWTATAGDDADRNAIDRAVRDEIRNTVLGGRLLRAGVGSAPLSAEIHAFMEDCLGMPVHNRYGSTEAGVALLDGRIMRPPVAEYKLVDVPELGYFTTDIPHPRGELLLKTRSIIPGYYKRPEATAKVFDADGFYRTGDIMAEIGPDRLAYVDRRNNVLKLSQGEFVAVSRLEAVFATSPLVRQVFVYGSSERSYLLAVVVPTSDALAGAGRPASLKAAIAESLQQVGREAKLNSYEIPRDFIVEPEPFTVENGLLSGIHKLLRPKLKERYGPRLERRYVELAESEAAVLHELRQTGPNQPVLPVLLRAAQALLGCSSADLNPDAHFTDLGGDSLSALSFSILLREIFETEVPVSVVISPANTLRTLAAHVEQVRMAGAVRPTFTSVHGAGATVVRAADLTLEKFVDAATLAAAAHLPHPPGEPITVLLTGATGYLGRFLCLEWLKRMEATGGTLICLVRGPDAQAAAHRLTDAFDTGDAELLDRYRTLAARHLKVLAGDIGDANLGLDETTWRRLADTVDLIAHPAALVNHVLPYDQLFGPNVVGTAELIKMALTSRITPITYVSSIAVLRGAASADEDDDIRVTSPQRPIDQSYANGYGISKWAGEVLLREANERFGLPVACFRSDMILAHSQYAGQLNLPDRFTRLLLSVLATGLAPRSFYRTDADRHRPEAHYDGLPVDFTAEAITELAARTTKGYHTFNVLNPHADGISLDVFVDWLIEAGHPIHRIDDYAEFYTRFDAAIRALPDRQKQHSLLPLLHAYTAPAEPATGAMIPAERFHSAVQDAKIGPDQDIPHITPKLIGKYATDLHRMGLV